MDNNGATAPIITVAIIEDVRTLREGYRILIDGTEGFACTDTFRSVEESVERIGRAVPDIVLMDIGLPGMSGIEGVRILRDRYPSLLVLMLTVYEDDSQVFNALCAGACGYLLKKTPPSKLLECLKEAVAGGAPMSPEIAHRVVLLFRKFRPPERADHALTAHEMRLLKLLVEGHSYKTAAAELGTSVNTVSFHIKQIYGKLHVHSKSEAVSKALRQGLIRL
jgi:DNA-binding NarL/FixJ family response regulator